MVINKGKISPDRTRSGTCGFFNCTIEICYPKPQGQTIKVVGRYWVIWGGIGAPVGIEANLEYQLPLRFEYSRYFMEFLEIESDTRSYFQFAKIRSLITLYWSLLEIGSVYASAIFYDVTECARAETVERILERTKKFLMKGCFGSYRGETEYSAISLYELVSDKWSSWGSMSN